MKFNSMSATFDVEEYLHLAVHASAARNPHACMTYLKELLKIEPRHPTALYVLALQHAEIGLVARALHELNEVLQISPDLDAARFQLTIMLLDSGQKEPAGQHIARLLRSPDASVRDYALGLLALADDKLGLAQQKIKEAMAQPQTHRLGPQMGHILALIEKRLQRDAKPAEAGERRISLGAYAGGKNLQE
jgi:tetratricopeptide (TPR) repeat protein